MVSRSFNYFFVVAGLILLFAVVACKETPPGPPAEKKPNLEMYLSHGWDSDSLNDNSWYTTASNQKVKIEFLAYRIAGLTLHKTDGGTYEAKNYEFVNAFMPHQRSFKLRVPEGSYNGISFLIGVDSVRNHSGAQDGALDPANGLYWEWNTGYIFSMLEGRCIKSGIDTTALSYHIGLDKFLVTHQKISFSPLVIGDGARSIYLNMNVAEVFKSPYTIDLSSDGAFTHSTDHEDLALKVKENYRDCFNFVKAE